MSMKRRAFLKSLAAAGMTGLAGDLAANTAESDEGKNRILILIELQGANDGLNTLVPYDNPLYYKLRPTLSIERDEVLQLSDHQALHPSLRGLYQIWNEGQLGIVQGLGYPNPNRSHFRSIEIWETASESDEVLEQGWLAPHLNGIAGRKMVSADALAVSQDAGPMAGATSNTIIMNNFDRFMRQARKMRALEHRTQNAALRHILSVHNRMQQAALGFSGIIDNLEQSTHVFPQSKLGVQLRTVAQLISSDIGISIYKLGLGSFDTHANQRQKHAQLLTELSDAIYSFKRAMQAEGLWNRILLMTYSEFGRRARENGSRGTDHGTAAPHFLAGGLVRGGLYGEAPSLSELQNDDLQYTLDFRGLYHTVQKDWLRSDTLSVHLQKFPVLDVFTKKNI